MNEVREYTTNNGACKLCDSITTPVPALVVPNPTITALREKQPHSVPRVLVEIPGTYQGILPPGSKREVCFKVPAILLSTPLPQKGKKETFPSL